MAFKKFFGSVVEVVAIAAVAIFAVMLCRQYFFNPYSISGASMVPSFHDGDYVFVDELSYRFREPQRGEVAVFHGQVPGTAGEDLIKRIIGLPGERVVINNGRVEIFNKDNPQGFDLDESYLGASDPTTGVADVALGAGEYFMMGDNRPVSFDSRSWGAVNAKDIVGVVRLRIWPMETAQAFAPPQY